MDKKSELIFRIKNYAVRPEDYRNGTELLKLMEYYNVNCLMVLSMEQLEDYIKLKENNQI